MASSSSRSEDGFATPAAAGVSLALAITVTAVMVRSGTELRRARADFERTRAEYALDGAAAAAEITLLQARPAQRFAWEITVDGASYNALVEAEAPKLALSSSAALNGSMLAKMGVRDAPELQLRLPELGQHGARASDIVSADNAAGWRSCGRSLISPWGLQTTLHLAHTTTPSSAGQGVQLGSIWRIQTTSATGFTDDRVVRFTGDPTHPAAVVERRLYRATTNKGDTCDSFADAKSQG